MARGARRARGRRRRGLLFLAAAAAVARRLRRLSLSSSSSSRSSSLPAASSAAARRSHHEPPGEPVQVPVGRLARQDPPEARRRGPRPRGRVPEVCRPADLEVALAVEVGGPDVGDAVRGVDFEAEEVGREGLLLLLFFFSGRGWERRDRKRGIKKKRLSFLFFFSFMS